MWLMNAARPWSTGGMLTRSTLLLKPSIIVSICAYIICFAQLPLVLRVPPF
jgi:hypothetical protein